VTSTEIVVATILTEMIEPKSASAGRRHTVRDGLLFPMDEFVAYVADLIKLQSRRRPLCRSVLCPRRMVDPSA
jgi:hypothetical protein